MKDVALVPATEEKKSSIEEHDKKAMSHIGDKRPARLRRFDIRVRPEHGYKMYVNINISVMRSLQMSKRWSRSREPKSIDCRRLRFMHIRCA